MTGTIATRTTATSTTATTRPAACGSSGWTSRPRRASPPSPRSPSTRGPTTSRRHASTPSTSACVRGLRAEIDVQAGLVPPVYRPACGDPRRKTASGRTVSWVRWLFARAPGEASDRNLSWHDDSTDLAADGRTLLLTASNLGGGIDYAVYLRGTDGSPALRLGDGFGYGLSPDGRWVLSFKVSGARLEFGLLPTRAGEPIRIAEDLPPSFHGAGFLPDSRSFVFSGSSPGDGARLYLPTGPRRRQASAHHGAGG